MTVFEDFARVLFHRSTLLLWLVLSSFLALSGPFGTYAAPFLERMAVWPLLVGTGLAAGIALRVALRHHLPGLGSWPRTLLAAAVLSAMLAPPAYRLATGLDHVEVRRDTLTGVAEAGVVIFVLSLGLSGLRVAFASGAGRVRGARIPFLDRLPPERRGRVIRLSSSDHYVRAVTERGAVEVLIRFADAIAELDGVEGLRVHRSHWVAADAVTGARRRNGRLFLLLRDGAEVPVSRRYEADVAARGFAPHA